MVNKIFILYGAHDIKVYYDFKNFKNCIKQFKKIVTINKLKYNNIVSIVENSIIESTNISIDLMASPEDYVKKKTELEKRALESFLKNKESLISTIIDKFSGKSLGDDDFSFQLSKFLKKKKVTIVYEENHSEVVKKEIEYQNKSVGETVNRVFTSSHEVDNLRDSLMVNQIKKLCAKHPEKSFVIVRGAFHNKLTNYLEQSGFNVVDYRY